MHQTLYKFLLTFIPIFVTIDAIGLAPLVLGSTTGLDEAQRRKMLRGAVVTAFAVGLVFLFVGKGLLYVLGVRVEDFMVAGGLLLMVISVDHMVHPERVHIGQRPGAESSGAVPLGVPLIMGPATITTLIMMSDRYGIITCLAAFVANIAVLAVVLNQVKRVDRILGKEVAAAVSKVMSILLAAIAVMMIRVGLEQILPGILGSTGS